LLRRTLNHTLQ